MFMMLTKLRTLARLVHRQQRCMSSESGDILGQETHEQSSMNREFDNIKVEHFETIYLHDQEKKNLIETILNEYEFTKYNAMGRVPSRITIKDMLQILNEGPTPEKRGKLFHYLFKREMDKRASKMREERLKEEKRKIRVEKLREFRERAAPRTGLLDANGQIVYGLWHNSLLCRIPENQLKSGMSDVRLRTSAMFGRKLIFDFGFEEYMQKQMARSSVDQIQESYGMNRFKYDEPFDLWFCNFDPNSYSAKFCSEKAINNLHTTSMITVKEDCFTNHFDKDQLVYLSPDARESLNNKIHKSDDIYIIGVFNDKGNHKPVSYRKASKLGIRARRLPLDTYLAWHGASKSLCINHVVGVLLEVINNGGDWQAAFMKHIPNRKIKPIEQLKMEEERRQAKFKSRYRARPMNIIENIFD